MFLVTQCIGQQHYDGASRMGRQTKTVWILTIVNHEKINNLRSWYIRTTNILLIFLLFSVQNYSFI